MRAGRPPGTHQLTDLEVFRQIRDGQLSFPPFSIDFEWPLERAHDQGFDGLLRLRWDGHDVGRWFAFEARAKWTPMAMQRLAARARENAPDSPSRRPLVILPYLSESHLEQLQAHGLGGLDLCGNGLLFDPPGLFVLRMGAKNRFPTSSPLALTYASRNLSSLVARIFLLEPDFPSLQAVLHACQARFMITEAGVPPLSLPTVSKAVAQLEQDLAISREGKSIRVSDPVRILESLTRSFQPPKTTASVACKTLLPVDATRTILAQLRTRVRVVVTGRGSASHHTGLAGPDRLQLYVNDLRTTQDALQASETAAFPNIELIETTDESVYFDAREHNGTLWASPIQTYLEMSQASPRERDVAEGLRAQLVKRTMKRPA